MLMYCKKCGRVVQERYGKKEQLCDYCNNNLEYIPSKFLINDIILNDNLKEQFIEEYIKSSSEFDQFLFEHRDEDLNNRRTSNRAKMAQGKAYRKEQSRVPKCPSCGSTNISKIGAISRMASIRLFGLASDKIGKTHKCNKCNTTW